MVPIFLAVECGVCTRLHVHFHLLEMDHSRTNDQGVANQDCEILDFAPGNTQHMSIINVMHVRSNSDFSIGYTATLLPTNASVYFLCRDAFPTVKNND